MNIYRASVGGENNELTPLAKAQLERTDCFLRYVLEDDPQPAGDDYSTWKPKSLVMVA